MNFIGEGGAGDVIACEIFDVRGRRVRHLESGAPAVGPFQLGWDGRGDHGMAVPPGVYLARVHRGSDIALTRIVLLR